MASVGIDIASLVASIIGGITGSSASSKAAETQAAAAKYAADLQYRAGQEANALQKNVYQQSRADTMPWLTTGTGALYKLSDLLGIDPATVTTTASTATGTSGTGTSGDGVTETSWVNPFTKEQLVAAYMKGQGTSGPAGEAFASQVADQWLRELENPPTGASSDDVISRFKLAFPDLASDAIITPLATHIADTIYNRDFPATPAEPIQQLSGPPAKTAQFGDLLKPFSTADFTADPGYAFRLSEGEKAISRTQAAKGGLLSGAAVKESTAYNSGLASQEFANAFDRYNINQNNLYNRLAAVAGTGQTAANTLTGAGQNYANASGNITMNAAGNVAQSAEDAATARASGYLGSAKSWNDAITNALKAGKNLSDLYNPAYT
jgi:hypothetical protein